MTQNSPSSPQSAEETGSQLLKLMLVAPEQRDGNAIINLLMPAIQAVARIYSAKYRGGQYAVAMDYDECLSALLEKLSRVINTLPIAPDTTAEGVTRLFSTVMKRRMVDLERKMFGQGKDGCNKPPMPISLDNPNAVGATYVESLSNPDGKNPFTELDNKEGPVRIQRVMAWADGILEKSPKARDAFRNYTHHAINDNVDISGGGTSEEERAAELGINQDAYRARLVYAQKKLDQHDARNALNNIFDGLPVNGNGKSRD